MAYTPSCMHRALLQALSILLFASILVPGSAEEAPSGYRIELIHVDANGGFTREELIRRAVDRTHLRAAMLSATDGTNSPASSGTYFTTKTIEVDGHHEYLMKLEIGTPPVPFFAVPDTGSDLIWTKQLKLCNSCASSTFTHVNCSDNCPGCCKSCPTGTCWYGLCMFKKMYGRCAKTASGFMGNETLTISGKTADKNVSFGCAIDNYHSLLPKSADGIVGLNRGNMSLVKQLNITNFSYCLSNPLKPELSSRLWFGDGDNLGLSAGGESSSSWQTTPLVQISIEPTSVLANKYYVELDGITIGKKYRSLQKDDFKLKSTKNKKGVMFVDSGCARTLLESTVFGVLKELLAEVLGPGKDPFTKDSSCLKAAPSKEPEMVLNFTGGATMHLPWANYVDKREEGLFCLAIHESKEYSVLGNFQQQNTHMLYDLTESKLSFKQNFDCSRLST